MNRFRSDTLPVPPTDATPARGVRRTVSPVVLDGVCDANLWEDTQTRPSRTPRTFHTE